MKTAFQLMKKQRLKSNKETKLFKKMVKKLLTKNLRQN